MNKLQKVTLLALNTILFPVLFYQQGIGLNLCILTIIVWACLNHYTKNEKKNIVYWLLSASVFSTCLAQAWYGDDLSIVALLLSIYAMGIYTQYPKLNFGIYPIVIGLNFISFIFRIFFIEQWLPERKIGNKVFKKIFSWILIPAIISAIFLAIYATGSTLISQFFKNLRLDFDFWTIVGLLALGFFLFFNFWIMFIPKEVIKINQILKDDFRREKDNSLKSTFQFLELDFERKSGIITLVALNIILLLFITTYNYEQFFMTPVQATLSEATHDRISTIIFSILMAIVVILFFFKSTFNFDKKSSLLKRLTYLWLILNGILLVSAFMKNYEYIQFYGLTFKRIGVFVFLVLCFMGIAFSYLKVKGKKTNSYLIKRMSISFFLTIVVCSLINFSWVVTKYNLTFCKESDWRYLESLNYNKQILYDHFKNNPEWKDYFKERNIIQKEETSKSWLSSSLYYYCIEWNRQ